MELNQVRYHGHLDSPDLTPLDILLREFAKDNIYFSLLRANVSDLRARITGAVAEVTPDKLRRIWEDILYR
jgi:hypothetical protein